MKLNLQLADASVISHLCTIRRKWKHKPRNRLPHDAHRKSTFLIAPNWKQPDEWEQGKRQTCWHIQKMKLFLYLMQTPDARNVLPCEISHTPKGIGFGLLLLLQNRLTASVVGEQNACFQAGKWWTGVDKRDFLEWQPVTRTAWRSRQKCCFQKISTVGCGVRFWPLGQQQAEALLLMGSHDKG